MSTDKRETLEARLQRLNVKESDLSETFSRSSGPGGQNVNKVSTAVTLVHIPSGLTIRAESSRTQQMNRQIARERLIETLESQKKQHRLTHQALRRKKRLAKAKRPKGVQEKILKNKRHRSNLKKLRTEKFH